MSVANVVTLVDSMSGHPTKRLVAVLALVRHFARVNALVDAKIISTRVVPLADGAEMGESSLLPAALHAVMGVRRLVLGNGMHGLSGPVGLEKKG